MPGVTQQTEKPGLFSEKIEAMVSQERSRRRGRLTPEKEEVYRIICKEALRKEAEDKIEFSLRGAIRRKKHVKMEMSVDEFSAEWRKKMKLRLKKDGYIFELTPAEQKVIKEAIDETTKKKIAEATNMASEALKKVILEA